MERRVLAWCLYDWANSAFSTVMVTAVLPVYFLGVAPERVAVFWMNWPAESLWAYTVGVSEAMMALLMPWLGAIADRVGSRYLPWVGFAVVGIGATVGIGLISPERWPWLLGVFIIANVGFGGSLVFYNALLPHIVGPGDYDRVSSWGYAWGYVGGGLALAGVMAWMMSAAYWQITLVDAVRHGLMATGLWWGMFGLVSFWGLRTTEPWRFSLQTWARALPDGWRQLMQTFHQIRRYRAAFRFLIAYLIYNDAVQTTIALAAVFGERTLRLSPTKLALVVLVVQFVAFPGTLIWERLARLWSTFRVIEILLGMWAIITAMAFFVHTEGAFWALALAVGLVLGGIQALSRSLYVRLFPPESSGEFFGFYAITSKFAAILGPILVGFITHLLGHIRYAIPWLVLFYLVGWGILRTIPLTERREARLQNERERLK